MFDWSTTELPNPNTSYGSAAQTSVIRSRMESGRIRQRRRFTSGLRIVDVLWKLTDAEFALFQGVYLYKLSSGADWFEGITLALGNSLEEVTARFVGDGYSADYVPVMEWRIKAKLEIENISPLNEAAIDAILDP